MEKNERLNKIIEIISNEKIATQSELASRLNEAGFNATQATVSRDIQKLSLAKKSDGQKKYYYLPEAPKYDANSVSSAVISIKGAENLVVIRTSEGMAMAVAKVIDDLHANECLGSIAGDDTIICACENAEVASAFVSILEAALL